MGRVTFGDIVRDVKNNVDRANNPYEFYVAGDHMNSEDLTIRRRGRFATDDVGPAFVRIFNPGQILYGSRRTYLKKVAVAGFSGICANTTFVLESKDTNVFDQRLLPFLMLSNAFTEWSISKSKGSTNPYVLFSDLAGFEFNLPPISEQKVLAEKLWAAYEVKQSYLKMIEATDEMVKAQFVEMFKDDTLVPLSQICDIEKGSTITRNEVIPGTIPVVAGGQEPSCYHNTSNRPANIITVSASGAYAGFVNFWSVPIFASDCNTISPKSKNETNIVFLYYGLKAIQSSVYNLQKGGAQPHVYGKDLEKLLFPSPQIEKQEQFANFAEQADKSKAELRKSIEAIDKVIKSLINENL